MSGKIEQAFHELEWHDAVLLSLNVDRQDPGRRDDVVLLVEWLDERRQLVRFTDCYALDARMSFGVTAQETIRSARCIATSSKLSEMRERWAALGVDLAELLCFEITTNSTASELRIYAKRFEVTDPS